MHCFQPCHRRYGTNSPRIALVLDCKRTLASPTGQDLARFIKASKTLYAACSVYETLVP